MKKILLTPTLLLFVVTAYTQDLAYEVRRKYERVIKKEALAEAKQLSDFIVGYPTNWVKDYHSVEVSAIENGNIQKAASQGPTLNIDQKYILRNVGLTTDIEISVWYNYPNIITANIEKRNMVVKMTVVPDIEAEYIGGYKKLKQYLKLQLDLLAENTPTEFQNGKVAFTINEMGNVADYKIEVSSGNTKVDDLLLEIISKIPSWKPAQNAKGENVKQNFVFSMGIGGC